MSRLSTVENPVHPWPALERFAVSDDLTSRTVKTRGTSVHKYKRSVATFSDGCLSHRPLCRASTWTYVSPRLRVSWYRQWLSNCGSRNYWMYSKLKEIRPCTCISKNAVAFDWSYYLNILNGRGNCIPQHLTFHLLLRINSNTFPTRS
jgi:hypothetical protein